MPDTVTTQNETRIPNISASALISFISQAQTNVAKGSFYNLKDDQRQAMLDQHTAVMQASRPFYTLIGLSGINDMNRQLITHRLVENTLREPGLKDHEVSPITRWENEIIMQILDDMPVTRVLDLLMQFCGNKFTNKRTMKLGSEWLKRNRRSWDLWAIKYRSQMKAVLRHFHTVPRTRGVASRECKDRRMKKDVNLCMINRYLSYREYENCGQLIQDYEAVRKGDKNKLAKLPSSVAEGFMTKFGMTKEEFWKLFTNKGGKFTAKETRLKATSVKKAGSTTKVDVRKLPLFDCLVYLKSLRSISEVGTVSEIRAILDRKAKDIAGKLPFTLNKVGVILDTSQSMKGTRDQPFHPMLKAMAVSMVMKHISDGEYKEYRTGGGNSLFPRLSNQSNYADCLIQALKDGCETIVFAGDGYENSPFEGAVHKILFTLKKQIDKKNKIMVLHMNPVFAAEAGDVRPISELASYVGVRDVQTLRESMFLAIAKQKPTLAMAKYMKHLAHMQSDRAKKLMPKEVKELVQGKRELIG